MGAELNTESLQFGCFSQRDNFSLAYCDSSHFEEGGEKNNLITRKAYDRKAT